MASPNPTGRPRGPDKRTKLLARMMDESSGILDAMIARAQEGDAACASLIFSRLLPTLRSQGEKVDFESDATAPVGRQIEMVLQAISQASVAPDVGKQIIEAIGTLASVRATEELEARLTALEQARAA